MFRTSPSKISTFRSIDVRLPGAPLKLLSKTRTSCPESTSFLTSAEPMNPVPPVTRTLDISNATIDYSRILFNLHRVKNMPAIYKNRWAIHLREHLINVYIVITWVIIQDYNGIGT